MSEKSAVTVEGLASERGVYYWRSVILGSPESPTVREDHHGLSAIRRAPGRNVQLTNRSGKIWYAGGVDSHGYPNKPIG